MADNNVQVKAAVLLENISNSSQLEDKARTLAELETLVDSRKYDVGPIFANSSLESLFECTQSDSNKVMKTSLRLLKKVLEIVDPIETTANYQDKIIYGFSRNDEEFKMLSVSQIKRLSVSQNGISFLVQHNVLLEKVTEAIACDYLSVAKIASQILLNVAVAEQGFDYFFSENQTKLFWNLMQGNSVVRYRTYELFVEILKSRKELLPHIQTIGVLSKLIAELDSDDILSMLNCLEMLSHVASSSTEGLLFIQENDLLSRLDRIIKTAASDPLQAFLLPGAIKFFGNIARSEPLGILSTYPSFITAVYENLTPSNDPALICLCAETLAIIVSTDDGLKALYQCPSPLKESMKIMGKIVHSSSEENMRTRIIGALATIFTCNHTSSEVSNIMEKLFRNLGPNPLAILWGLCKQPFPNLRCGGLEIISGIVQYSWGEQEVALTAGFLEYLLDRKTEPDKEGKELKYAIMKRLSVSTTSKENIGREYYDRVCQYVKDGPFYSGRDAAVSFEGAD